MNKTEQKVLRVSSGAKLFVALRARLKIQTLKVENNRQINDLWHRTQFSSRSASARCRRAF